MCGRFTFAVTPEMFMQRYNLEQLSFDLEPRYNIAPSQMIPAVLQERGQNRAGQLKWGLVPRWAQDERIGFKMINARAETVADKPAFREAFRRKRCILPADGFYEWKRVDGSKQPMRIMLKSEQVFSMAGLYETWTAPDGRKVHSCTVITTKPNELVQDIHDRMPVILRPEDEDLWLNREAFDPDLLQSLLRPFPADEMTAYPVAAMVGNVRNDLPECIRPM